ncbi:Integrin beta-4 [Thelohanellus kitauei]|uniref:Integrin beta-4 n=1 Tax=Thelohanellus kitauei TaxID=669202 RepID=A0A0C2MNB7_THEKT|nr:Integrin beta-4 [Thelohanellus kitauei]
MIIGPDKGSCRCEGCVCHPKYNGTDCSQRNCSHPDWHALCMTNGSVCNSHGTCECGTCQCDEEHVGDHCQFRVKQNPDCIKYYECMDCKIIRQAGCKDYCEIMEIYIIIASIGANLVADIHLMLMTKI